MTWPSSLQVRMLRFLFEISNEQNELLFVVDDLQTLGIFILTIVFESGLGVFDVPDANDAVSMQDGWNIEQQKKSILQHHSNLTFFVSNGSTPSHSLDGKLSLLNSPTLLCFTEKSWIWSERKYNFLGLDQNLLNETGLITCDKLHSLLCLCSWFILRLKEKQTKKREFHDYFHSPTHFPFILTVIWLWTNLWEREYSRLFSNDSELPFENRDSYGLILFYSFSTLLIPLWRRNVLFKKATSLSYTRDTTEPQPFMWRLENRFRTN